jgi:hypothetical protein
MAAVSSRATALAKQQCDVLPLAVERLQGHDETTAEDLDLDFTIAHPEADPGLVMELDVALGQILRGDGWFHEEVPSSRREGEKLDDAVSLTWKRAPGGCWIPSDHPYPERSYRMGASLKGEWILINRATPETDGLYRLEVAAGRRLPEEIRRERLIELNLLAIRKDQRGQSDRVLRQYATYASSVLKRLGFGAVVTTATDRLAARYATVGLQIVETFPPFRFPNSGEDCYVMWVPLG